jgi:hypothetical protein
MVIYSKKATGKILRDFDLYFQEIPDIIFLPMRYSRLAIIVKKGGVRIQTAHDDPYRVLSAGGGIMSIKLTSLFSFAFVFCCVPPSMLLAATQVSQFGITWTFDKDYPCGQFANGDHWVVGPVTIARITPSSAALSDRTMNGSMVNPSPANSSQGYDSSMAYTTYDANLNKALNVSSDKPLILPPGSSLVSTISVAAAGARPQVQTAAILTVLADAPPSGSFRPPYSGSDKTIRYNKSQLNYSLLKSLLPAGNAPGLGAVERYFERPWIDHQGGWTGRFQHPADNMPDYGDQISRQIGDGALMLHLNFTNSEKETLLVRYVQLGIDLYGIVKAGGTQNWSNDGGHASGRKWPIMFAGLMLNNPAMVTIGSYDTTGVHFGEDDQTFYVSQSDLAIQHYYAPEKTAYTNYVAADIGLPEWGIRHATIPDYDGKNWDAAAYRTTNTANSWAGFVLAAQIMNQKAAWNHAALFDYMDRYMAVEKTLGNAGTGWQRQWSKFAEGMWDAYRTGLGCVWTPTNPADIYSNGTNSCGNNNHTAGSNHDEDNGDYTSGRLKILPPKP